MCWRGTEERCPLQQVGLPGREVSISCAGSAKQIARSIEDAIVIYDIQADAAVAGSGGRSNGIGIRGTAHANDRCAGYARLR